MKAGYLNINTKSKRSHNTDRPQLMSSLRPSLSVHNSVDVRMPDQAEMLAYWPQYRWQV